MSLWRRKLGNIAIIIRYLKDTKGGGVTESNLTIEREIGEDTFLIISLWLFFEHEWKVDQRIQESVRGCFILKT